MPQQRINDIELSYEVTGDGHDTVVLVHGSWTDQLSWGLVVPALAERHRVVTYDRRGHSRSVAPTGQGSPRRQHEDDLASLIETLDLGVVHLVGNSYGGSISLGTASRRPDLVRSVIAHEPPLVDVNLLQPPVEVDLVDVHEIVEEVGALLRAGELEEGARLFIERVALGPGTWPLLPEELRRTFVANAATFLDMLADPCWGSVPAVDGMPTLLTDGDASPPWLPGIVDALAATACRDAARRTLAGAGHVPHLTHSEAWVAAIESFLSAGKALDLAGPT